MSPLRGEKCNVVSLVWRGGEGGRTPNGGKSVKYRLDGSGFVIRSKSIFYNRKVRRDT
jgi:hypothetical protein